MQEWYLMKSPTMTSGDEGDILYDFGEDAIDELLANPIADDLELYNHDLSECIPFRAVVNDKVQDTKLKTLNRQFVTKIGTCKAGQYVKYKGRFWLIVSLIDDNHIYEKVIMTICNHMLTWQNKNGEIIQRYANVTSASQYNNGETSTQYYTLRTDQLLILTSNDDESMLLASGQRFIIDSRCKIYEKYFDETVAQNLSNPVITYELTRADSVLYDYQDGGLFECLVTQDEQHEEDGYYVIDGTGYWLCGVSPNNKSDSAHSSAGIASIEYDSLAIYNAVGPSAYIARFYDESGNEVEAEPSWEIDCDFADEVMASIVDNAIYLSTNNKKLVGRSLVLILNGEGYEPTSVTIKIKAFS